MNSALAFRKANPKVSFRAIVDQCKLKMTGQRLGQIFEQYNAADPQRPEIDHSLTEPLRREAGKQLHAI